MCCGLMLRQGITLAMGGVLWGRFFSFALMDSCEVVFGVTRSSDPWITFREDC